MSDDEMKLRMNAQFNQGLIMIVSALIGFGALKVQRGEPVSEWLTMDSLSSTPAPIAIGMAVILALAISSLLKKRAEKKAMDGGPSRRTRSKTK